MKDMTFVVIEQLKQPRCWPEKESSLKGPGIEPMTIALPVRCSAN